MPSRKSFLFKIYALLRYRKAAVLNRSRAAESVATDPCMKLIIFTVKFELSNFVLTNLIIIQNANKITRYLTKKVL